MGDCSEREKALYLAPSSAMSVDNEDRWLRVLRLTLSMFPWRRISSSRVEDSKLAKYGSKSCSERFWDVGGKRPKTCGPGMECAAEEAKVE